MASESTFIPRYSTKQLFAAITLLALASAAVSLVNGCVYHERRRINALIARYPEIASVSYGAFMDEFTETVVVTTIQLHDRPDVQLKLYGLQNHNDGQFQHLTIQQIGDEQFLVGGYGNLGNVKTATQEPVKSQFWTTGVDVGPDSEFKDVLPFTVTSLGELFDRYDELLAYFANWPKQDDPGTIMFPDGIERYYFVGKGKLRPLPAPAAEQ